MAGQGQTWLQIVNIVLPRMREATVAAVTTTAYSTYISTLVNQVKAEIEAAYQWQALRDTYTVATVSGTSSYTLTSSGRGCKIISVWNFTDKYEITRSYRARFDQHFFGETVVKGKPTLYLPNGFDSAYDLKIQVWPQPDSVVSLRVNVYRPQAELSAGTDVPLCPINPLIEGVVARAMLERGDDGGLAAQQQDAYYKDILASYVSAEASHDESELYWVPV